MASVPGVGLTLGGMGRYETNLDTLALTFHWWSGLGLTREAMAAGNPVTGARPVTPVCHWSWSCISWPGSRTAAAIEFKLGSRFWSWTATQFHFFRCAHANVFVQRRWENEMGYGCVCVTGTIRVFVFLPSHVATCSVDLGTPGSFSGSAGCLGGCRPSAHPISGAGEHTTPKPLRSAGLA